MDSYPFVFFLAYCNTKSPDVFFHIYRADNIIQVKTGEAPSFRSAEAGTVSATSPAPIMVRRDIGQRVKTSEPDQGKQGKTHGSEAYLLVLNFCFVSRSSQHVSTCFNHIPQLYSTYCLDISVLCHLKQQ